MNTPTWNTYADGATWTYCPHYEAVISPDEPNNGYQGELIAYNPQGEPINTWSYGTAHSIQELIDNIPAQAEHAQRVAECQHCNP